MKKVQLDKVGNATIMTTYYTENPDKKNVYSIAVPVQLYIVGQTINGDLLFPKVCFRLDQVVDNYGATTKEDLLTQFAERGIFNPEFASGSGPVPGGSLTDFVEIEIADDAPSFSDPALIGKSAVNMLIINNAPVTDIPAFDPETGTVEYEVYAGDKIIVFYTN